MKKYHTFNVKDSTYSEKVFYLVRQRQILFSKSGTRQNRMLF